VKKIVSFIAAFTLVFSIGICYGAGNDAKSKTKLTPEEKEYFKNAGKPTDPSYQDYVETKAKQDAKKAEDKKTKENKKTAEEKKKTESDNKSGSYAKEQEKIKERVKNSPKYTVPNIDKKGSYGEAK